MCTKSTNLAVHPSLLVLCPDPMNVHARGSGYTSPNPWAFFRIWKCPIRSQSSVY